MPSRVNIDALISANSGPLIIHACHAFMKHYEWLNKHRCVTSETKAKLLISLTAFEEISKISSIHMASSIGRIEIVRFLIDEGAKVNQRQTVNGRTALIEASLAGHFDVAALLLEKGAKVNQGTDHDWTALMAASQAGHYDVATLLLENGANINQGITDNGRTALMEASQVGHYNLVTLLLEKGAQVNQGTTDIGWTALMEASLVGQTDVVNLLLENGAKVNQGTTDDGWTALMAAIAGGHYNVVNLLLENGAKVNQGTTETGWTALMEATKAGYYDVVKLLLSQDGINIYKKNKNGLTAAMIAYENEHQSIISLMFESNDISFSKFPLTTQMAFPSSFPELFESKWIEWEAKDDYPFWEKLNCSVYRQIFKERNLIAVRHTIPSFYPEVRCYEFLLDLGEESSNLQSTLFVEKGDKIYYLNGSSIPVHQINQQENLFLDGKTILNYLKFSGTTVYVVNSVFRCITSVENINFTKKVKASEKNVINKLIKPFDVMFNKHDGYMVNVITLYSRQLFDTKYQISLDGTVRMVSDKLILSDLPVSNETFEQGLRCFLLPDREISKENWITLIPSSISGHVEAVKVILESDVDVNFKDKGGKTALDYSIGEGHEEISQMLELAGAKRGEELQKE